MDEALEKASNIEFRITKVSLAKIPRDAFSRASVHSEPVSGAVVVAHMWATVELELDGRVKKVALTRAASDEAKKKLPGSGWTRGEQILIHKAVVSLIPETDPLRASNRKEKEKRQEVLRRVVGTMWSKVTDRIRTASKKKSVRFRAEREWRKSLKEKMATMLKPVLKEAGPHLNKKLLLEILEEVQRERVAEEVMNR